MSAIIINAVMRFEMARIAAAAKRLYPETKASEWSADELQAVMATADVFVPPAREWMPPEDADFTDAELAALRQPLVNARCVWPPVDDDGRVVEP